MDVSPFNPAVVKATFSDMTWIHVSRPAVRVAASVTRTLLTGIIQGAKTAAAEERCTVLQPRHLVAAIDRNVEVDVANEWYDHSRRLSGEKRIGPAPQQQDLPSPAACPATRTTTPKPS
ncbi:hypothetical protein ACPCKW_35655 [Streptomyces griseoincarnatus]